MTDTASALDLPFDDAIRFFRDKANVTTKAWTDVYAAAHSRSFMVAGAASDALVADFRTAVDRAIADGTTLADFRADFDDIVGRHGWDYRGGRNWRSRVIFETNLKTAYAAGRHAALTAPETLQTFPYWQYNHSGALHPRQEHLAWDGMVLPAGDTFWQTNYPPNGWGCGCFVTPVSRPQLGRLGKSGPDEAPDLVFRAEEIGGRTVRVPQGVDPGFEYNPGQAWLSRTAPGAKTVASAPGMIGRFVNSALAGKRPPDAYIPAAIAPEELAAAIQVAPATEIRLTAGAASRIAAPGRIAVDALAALPEQLVATGQLIRTADGRLVLTGSVDGVEYLATIEVARYRAGAAVYVETLQRIEPDDLAELMRGATVLAR